MRGRRATSGFVILNEQYKTKEVNFFETTVLFSACSSLNGLISQVKVSSKARRQFLVHSVYPWLQSSIPSSHSRFVWTQQVEVGSQGLLECGGYHHFKTLKLRWPTTKNEEKLHVHISINLKEKQEFEMDRSWVKISLEILKVSIQASH